MSTAADRATWKALAEGATEGPVWDRYEPGQCCDGVCIAGPTGTGIHDANVTTGLADFIAAARTAVPALLADVERLEASLIEAAVTTEYWANKAARLKAENRRLREADL